MDTVWILQTKKWGDFRIDDLDMAKKGKLQREILLLLKA